MAAWGCPMTIKFLESPKISLFLEARMTCSILGAAIHGYLSYDIVPCFKPSTIMMGSERNYFAESALVCKGEIFTFSP